MPDTRAAARHPRSGHDRHEDRPRSRARPPRRGRPARQELEALGARTSRERQWGTVREDYSAARHRLGVLPARPRALARLPLGRGRPRWASRDRHQYVCFALALWNGQRSDPQGAALRPDGQRGQPRRGRQGVLLLPRLDADALLHEVRSTSTRSARSRTQQLVDENRRRGRDDPEFELLDTGVFDDDRYFDVFVEYAKAAPDDILDPHRRVANRGPEAAHAPPAADALVPQHLVLGPRRRAARACAPARRSTALRDDRRRQPSTTDGSRLHCEGAPELLFTENETNARRLFGAPTTTRRYVKDGIHDYVVHGAEDAVNPAARGTKAAAHYVLTIAGRRVARSCACASPTPRRRQTAVRRRLRRASSRTRQREADEFYARSSTPDRSPRTPRTCMRQAFAGLLWRKQFYHYDVARWLARRSGRAAAAAGARCTAATATGRHLYNADVISMPDKWEYPWYAAWDLAFHCIPLALVDPDFAKEQLILLLREWYMHPNGQLPAYEWALRRREPAGARLGRVARLQDRAEALAASGDRAFLERVFHKLLLNFTWWVNRKDAEGKQRLPGRLPRPRQHRRLRPPRAAADGRPPRAVGRHELDGHVLPQHAGDRARAGARRTRAYEDVASKFFEHFVYIADAMNNIGGEGIELWDERGRLLLRRAAPARRPRSSRCKVRSMVGLIPLFAVETLESERRRRAARLQAAHAVVPREPARARASTSRRETTPDGQRAPLPLARRPRPAARACCRYMLDESEFLSPYGDPLAVARPPRPPVRARRRRARSTASTTSRRSPRRGLFGGNSNWRGPVWFPVNFLLIESLQKFHHYLGDDVQGRVPDRLRPAA